MEKYDIQKLRDLPIEGVAERLGLRVSRHKTLCPFHADTHPSLSFKVSKNTFRCFVCGAHGGTIDLVMRFLNKPFREACRWLADEHCVILTEWKPAAIGQKPFDASRYEPFFEHPFLNDDARRFLFDERRLDPRVVRWCRLTSWRDREGTPWLQTPYYDREGRLVGVQNRNLSLPLLGEVGGGSPRFRFPSGSLCGIYNLPVLNLLKPGDELYITEGCSDCWAMLSAGHKAIAIPSATLLSPKDAEQLSALNVLCRQGERTVHMFPDADAPGERLFLQLQKVLPALVRHQLPAGCKDFSDYYLQSKP
jgi:DNA primase